MRIKLSILLLFVLTNLSSQDYKFGVSYHQNFGSQLYHFPDMPNDDELSEEIIRFGISAFLERKLRDDFSLQVVVGYQQKGGKNSGLFTVIDVDGIATSTNQLNTFNFDLLTLESNLVFHPFDDFFIRPFILGGLGYNYLIEKEYERDVDLLMWQEIPTTVLDNSRNSILNLKLGTGIKFKNIAGLGVSANHDITPILKDDLVHVRHFVWSIDASLFLSSIFRNKK